MWELYNIAEQSPEWFCYKLTLDDTKHIPIEEIEKEAETMSAEKIAAVKTGLRLLAGMDEDHAAELNGVGFSKIDVRIGHFLAAVENLTPKQSALGAKLCKRYHRQLPAEINEVINA